MIRRLVPSSRRARIVSGVVGIVAAGAGAFAATNWVVGLAGGSTAEGQSANVSNLTVSAVALPSGSNLLYPGSNGDVALTISNPNNFPVTISAVNLPSSATFASGFSDSGLTSAQTGCGSGASDVTWNYSTATSGSSHTLTTPVTVGASGAADNPLTVTLTDDASMASGAPAACEDTYFQMPALAGVTATASSDALTSSPATDGWTS